MPRLLLVDDSESNRMVISALLEDEGYQLAEAATLAEARALLADGRHYDAALLDLHLPDGLGSQLIPELRARQPAPKIVVISGSMMEGEMDPRSVDDVLVKGSSFEELVSILRRLVGAPR